MEIIRINRDTLTKKEKHLLVTSGEHGKSLRTKVDTTLKVKDFALYERANEKGEVVQILGLCDVDNNYYYTTSPSFIRGFVEIADIFWDEETTELEIVVNEGESKAGRKFLKCRIF